MTYKNFGWILKRFFLLLPGCLFPSFETLPKAELHLHLGGTYPLEYLRSIASEEDFVDLEKMIGRIANGISYNEGFQVFSRIGKIVNTEEKLEGGVVALCRQLERDHVVYAEIRTSLKDLGNGYEEYLRAALKGIERGKSDRFEAKLLLSLTRASSPELAAITVDLALKYKNQGIVGIDLSGNSTLGDIRKIVPELARAKRSGLFLALHLGESRNERDPEEILDLLQPDRIGHAVFLSEEAKRSIFERRIPIEMCLTSAVKVQMIENYQDHPALSYFSSGHPVSVCTDDPLIFQTSLSNEMRLAFEKGGLSFSQIEKMAAASFDSAFLEEEDKIRLKKRYWEKPVLMKEPPENFFEKAKVACVLPFLENDRVLLLQRVPNHPQGNLWTAPGGKILTGETPNVAAVRELQEETGIAADPKALIDLGKFYVRYPNGDFVFYLFKIFFPCESLDVEIRNEEHQSFCYCPLHRLSSLSLTPGLDECFDLAKKI